MRVYEGEVEQLAVADSQGVGVRVVRDGRQGFAYCGTFDADALAETVGGGPRQRRLRRARRGRRRWPSPTASSPSPLDLWRPGLADVPTADKVALAVELERAVLGADPRITGVESCDYADSRAEAAIATTTGIRRASRETGCELVAYSLAADGDDTQTGFGFSLGRSFDELDVGVAARDAADRALRMLGATKPPSGRLTVVLDPWVTAQLVGIVAGTLGAEEVVKGRSLFAGRVGEQVASPLVTLVEDPTDARSWGATPVDDEGLATRRVPLVDGGRAAGLRPLDVDRPPPRHGLDRLGGAGRVQDHADAPAAGPWRPTPGTATAADAGGRGRRRRAGPGGVGPALGGQPGVGRPVDRRRGPAHPGRRGGRAAARVHDRVDAAAPAARRAAVGSDLTWLPMSAAGLTLVVGDVAVSGS